MASRYCKTPKNALWRDLGCLHLRDRKNGTYAEIYLSGIHRHSIKTTFVTFILLINPCMNIDNSKNPEEHIVFSVNEQSNRWLVYGYYVTLITYACTVWWAIIMINWWLWLILTPLYFILAIINSIHIVSISGRYTQFRSLLILTLLISLLMAKSLMMDAWNGSSQVGICSLLSDFQSYQCFIPENIAKIGALIGFVVYFFGTIFFRFILRLDKQNHH